MLLLVLLTQLISAVLGSHSSYYYGGYYGGYGYPTPWPTPSPTGSNCNPANMDWGCCSSYNQCNNGEGDCDSDSDCAGGGYCDHNVGSQYGATSSFDVCAGGTLRCDPSNYDWSCCSWNNPCGDGEGDCDSDSDCLGYCSHNVGSQYGATSSFDICIGGGNGLAACDPSNLNWDCCDYYRQCADGEGDCDYDSDCISGNCGQDVGLQYNATASFDVCVPFTCDPFRADWNCCTASAPCQDGWGDCDSDSDCLNGNCVLDVGSQYGAPSSFDVCETPRGAGSGGTTPAPTPSPPCLPVNMDWACCTAANPCADGQGDCDEDSDCQSGTCVHNVGANYGVDARLDICETPCDPRNNDWSCCSYYNRCGNGQGDCDYDSDCLSNYCANDRGDAYGTTRTMDICEVRPPTVPPTMPPYAYLADLANDTASAGVMLVGGDSGPGFAYGNVYLNGYPICDSSWSSGDAQVVCRMLGYDTGKYTVSSRAGGYVWPNFQTSSYGCYGSEASIEDCYFSTYVSSWCSPSSAAGVICNNLTPAPGLRNTTAGCDTLSRDECCSHVDGRWGYEGEQCVHTKSNITSFYYYYSGNECEPLSHVITNGLLYEMGSCGDSLNPTEFPTAPLPTFYSMGTAGSGACAANGPGQNLLQIGNAADCAAAANWMGYAFNLSYGTSGMGLYQCFYDPSSGSVAFASMPAGAMVVCENAIGKPSPGLASPRAGTFPSLPRPWSMTDFYTDYFYISDGGGDMYDTGNRLSISTLSLADQSDLVYGDGCSGTTSIGDGFVWASCYNGADMQVVDFYATDSLMTEFKVTGNLGADGSGVRTTSGPLTRPGGYTGYAVEVTGAGDPTITKILVASTADGWTCDNLSYTTDVEDWYCYGTGTTRLVYVLAAGRSDRARLSITQLTNLMDWAWDPSLTPAPIVGGPPTPMPVGYLRCDPSNYDWSCCSYYAPCGDGEGDCDYDSDCISNYCAMNVGSMYGATSSFDVCIGGGSTSPCDPINMDWGCCSYYSTCASGEGDCDSDSDCDYGLYCAHDVGSQYGATSSFDVCLSGGGIGSGGTGCSPYNMDWSCCSYYSPCANGEGDCDYDSDCISDYCSHNVGSQYGATSSFDVCTAGYGYSTPSPTPGGGYCSPSYMDWSCCSYYSKCYDGEGDCDSDSDCYSGYCAHDTGALWGATPSFDVCGYGGIGSGMSYSPTISPTTIPTAWPTMVPTEVPTKPPTTVPTGTPTNQPSPPPTPSPTASQTPLCSQLTIKSWCKSFGCKWDSKTKICSDKAAVNCATATKKAKCKQLGSPCTWIPGVRVCLDSTAVVPTELPTAALQMECWEVNKYYSDTTARKTVCKTQGTRCKWNNKKLKCHQQKTKVTKCKKLKTEAECAARSDCLVIAKKKFIRCTNA